MIICQNRFLNKLHHIDGGGAAQNRLRNRKSPLRQHRIVRPAHLSTLARHPFLASTFEALLPHVHSPPPWEHSAGSPKAVPKNSIWEYHHVVEQCDLFCKGQSRLFCRIKARTPLLHDDSKQNAPEISYLCKVEDSSDHCRQLMAKQVS